MDAEEVAGLPLQVTLEPATPYALRRDQDDLGRVEAGKRVADRLQRIVRADLSLRADPSLR